MKVILKETISSLGIIGSEITVKNGYARNYLLPQGKALIANKASRDYFAQAKAKIDLKIAKEKSLAEELAKKVENIVITLKAKLKETAKDTKEIFGSIGIRDIMKELESKDVAINKKQLLLVSPIKETGEYKVSVNLYKNIEPKITVNVIPE